MRATPVIETEATPGATLPEYGPHPASKQCGCAERLSDLERQIVQLQRLYRAGEICGSTYRGALQQLEAKVALLSREF